MLQKIKWYALHAVHNCIAHPLLVVAETFLAFGFLKGAEALWVFHDVTTPQNDRKNVKMLSK